MRLGQGFAKQPDRFGIWNALIQIQPQESHEGQPGTDLIFGLVIRQIIEGLEDERFEHQHGIKGWPSPFFPLGATDNGVEGRPASQGT